jgi:hypothetical protein
MTSREIIKLILNKEVDCLAGEIVKIEQLLATKQEKLDSLLDFLEKLDNEEEE